MLFLIWSGFWLAESWACRLSLYLACKPFRGLCACTRTSRWCASVVVIRPLSLFTNRADRRSQINSLDSCCATRVSKTLDVVHRYALLVTPWVTRLEPVSLWLTSSRSRHGPKCHPCHYPSRCVLKWNCCNDYLTLPVQLRMSLVIRILHCYFIVYYIILWVYQLIDWPSLVYSPWLWDTGFKCKSSTRFMCLIINHFVMYYSNPHVNYMVTVFIRLVIAVV